MVVNGKIGVKRGEKRVENVEFYTMYIFRSKKISGGFSRSLNTNLRLIFSESALLGL